MITPYLTVRNAAAAIDFYAKAFGAKETGRIETAGKIGHAEMEIEGSKFMLSDEYPEMNILSPEAYGGTGVKIHVHVKDVDSFAERAVAAGLKVLRPVEDQFYGDRSGMFADPFGHVWNFATHKEDLSLEEIQRRATKLWG